MSESHAYTFVIEVYDLNIKDDWRQGKYLVHGFGDELWTDDLGQALAFIKQSCETCLYSTVHNISEEQFGELVNIIVSYRDKWAIAATKHYDPCIERPQSVATARSILKLLGLKVGRDGD